MATRKISKARQIKAEMEETASHDFEAMISSARMKKIEEACAGNSWGIKRRIMLASLSRSKEQLVTAIRAEGGPEVTEQAIELINDYRKHLQTGIELADSATARLIVAVAAAAVAEGWQ